VSCLSGIHLSVIAVIPPTEEAKRKWSLLETSARLPKFQICVQHLALNCRPNNHANLRQKYYTSPRYPIDYMYILLHKDYLRVSRRIAISVKPAVYRKVKYILARNVKLSSRGVQAFVTRCQTFRVGDYWTGGVER
jgi:hypothetical protein